jgi:pectin methylesterase-like acyl-CoA thioesterase
MFYVYPFVTYLLTLPRSIGMCRQNSLELPNINLELYHATAAILAQQFTAMVTAQVGNSTKFRNTRISGRSLSVKSAVGSRKPRDKEVTFLRSKFRNTRISGRYL